MVISLLHHFFQHHGVGEKYMDAHCDNCSGQNKNKFVLWYYCWRVLCGLHDEITLNFLPVGHTKFSPDWCFGLLRQKFRREEVVTLDDLCHIVNTSTQRGIIDLKKAKKKKQQQQTNKQNNNIKLKNQLFCCCAGTQCSLPCDCELKPLKISKSVQCCVSLREEKLVPASEATLSEGEEMSCNEVENESEHMPSSADESDHEMPR
jgi:hypothetical protein